MINYKHIRIGVATLVLNNKHEILFLKRKDKFENEKQYYGNHFALPGGKLEFKESIFDCAKRELYEETGIKARKLELITLTEIFWDYYNEHWLTFGVLVKKYSNKPRIKEPEKHELLCWYQLNHLPSPLFAADKNLLENIKHKVFFQQKVLNRKGYF